MAKQNLEVKGIVAKPGTKVKGYVEVGEYHDGSKVRLPVILINGAGEGPTFLVNSAIHGDEITTLEATKVFANELDPKDLSGNVMVFPICNPAAFVSRNRTSLMDLPDFYPIDANQVFPGQEKGLLPYRIVNTLIEMGKGADYVLEMHGSPKNSNIYPYANTYDTPDDPTGEKMLPMALAFGSEFVYTYKPDSNKLEALQSAIPVAAKGWFNKCLWDRYKTKGVTFEAGEGNRINEEYMDVSVRGIYNLLKFVNMLEGEPEVPENQPVFERKFRVRANRGGFMRIKVENGKFYKKGTLIALITNVFGETVEELKMPEDGTIYRVCTRGTVTTGDHIVCCVTSID